MVISSLLFEETHPETPLNIYVRQRLYRFNDTNMQHIHKVLVFTKFRGVTTPTLHGGREKILIGFILIILELEVFLHNSTVGLFVPYATASIGTNLMYN